MHREERSNMTTNPDYRATIEQLSGAQQETVNSYEAAAAHGQRAAVKAIELLGVEAMQKRWEPYATNPQASEPAPSTAGEREGCDMCRDPDGVPCFPEYGVGPHTCFYKIPGAVVGQSQPLPKDQWPDNYMESPPGSGMGIYWCSHCGHGKPSAAALLQSTALPVGELTDSACEVLATVMHFIPASEPKLAQDVSALCHTLRTAARSQPVREPLTVDVFYLEGHDPFICGVYGKLSLGALSEIESDIQGNPDFQKGDGVYSYSVTRFEGQYGFEGRCELAPGWELCEASYTPLAAAPEAP
jgi:hypothetical protein